MADATVFDVVVGAAVDQAGRDKEVAAALATFFAETESAIPGGWQLRDGVQAAAMDYATQLAENAFRLGWQLRADPDGLRDVADTR